MVLVVGRFVASSGLFFFPLFSFLLLKIMLTIENFRVILLFIKISILILTPLIFTLYSWSFYKILICFHHSIPFVICYFSNIVLIRFDFFCPFVKLFFFSISPFNQNFIGVL